MNHWQQVNSNGYSRKFSFMILCLVGGLLVAPVMGIWMGVFEKPRGRLAAPIVLSAPTAGPKARTPGWLVALRIWLIGAALAWVGVLAYHGWDFHQRRTVSLAFVVEAWKQRRRAERVE